MWKFVLVLVLASLGACKKDPPAPPPPVVVPSIKPAELNVEGALHAVACGGVTAVWTGNPDALKDLPQPAPKSFAVESLSFKFADGSSKGFAPTGQPIVEEHRRFEVFSPDCSMVALLTDHYGPYHVVKTAELRGYLERRIKPVQVQALSEKESLVHSDLVWKDAGKFEFTASCCGGAQVFSASTKDGSLERIFEAPSAPKGLRRVGTKYEVIP